MMGRGFAHPLIAADGCSYTPVTRPSPAAWPRRQPQPAPQQTAFHSSASRCSGQLPAPSPPTVRHSATPSTQPAGRPPRRPAPLPRGSLRKILPQRPAAPGPLTLPPVSPLPRGAPRRQPWLPRQPAVRVGDEMGGGGGGGGGPRGWGTPSPPIPQHPLTAAAPAVVALLRVPRGGHAAWLGCGPGASGAPGTECAGWW
ncbi:hypothetical protein I4F81_004425 [Pyropia yezoensis]|uniref:Uncharacterized protein n=1 Tax=Pyropia yezoensis TaxID=2788 RepID=A0ACC3BVT4_PYRYE|nr:hypothetical protein I4F81_004425 [Neopyropia yezoensis]